MPIKEEPVRIEFQYEQKDAQTSDGTFSVEYFSEKDGDGKEIKCLSITPKNSDISQVFEVDFFVEVVDFLRSKGVVKNKIEEMSGTPPVASSLSLPKIQIATSSSKVSLPTVSLKDSCPTPTAVDAMVQSGTQIIVDPDVKMNGIPVSTFVKNGDSEIISPTAIMESQVKTPKVFKEPTAEEKQPIINRPVIRTRVGEKEDPMKAYKDAEQQRKSNPQKTIKRKEADDAV